jgi:hypothetical protein
LISIFFLNLHTKFGLQKYKIFATQTSLITLNLFKKDPLNLIKRLFQKPT